MNLYREVDLEKEPCVFVGVHCLQWHDHPDQPTVGFVEVALDDVPEVKQLKRAFENQITRIEELEAQVKALKAEIAPSDMAEIAHHAMTGE